MANWCNLRLSVIGRPDDVLAFRKDAGRLEGRIKAAKSKIFLPEMEIGESRDLEAAAAGRFRRTFQRAEYLFQGRNDDHGDHFRSVSERYPRLAFVLTYGDPNADAHGSHLFLAGRQRIWQVPQRLHRELMRRHYRRWKALDARGRMDYDHEQSSEAEWDAYFEMMDRAAAHWDDVIERWLRGGSLKG